MTSFLTLIFLSAKNPCLPPHLLPLPRPLSPLTIFPNRQLTSLRRFHLMEIRMWTQKPHFHLMEIRM